MPTYAYACKDCGHAFDIQQSFTDDSLTVCPECGGNLRKKFNSVGVVFKGSGFYRTDSRDAASTVPAAPVQGCSGQGQRHQDCTGSRICTGGTGTSRKLGSGYRPAAAARPKGVPLLHRRSGRLFVPCSPLSAQPHRCPAGTWRHVQRTAAQPRLPVPVRPRVRLRSTCALPSRGHPTRGESAGSLSAAAGCWPASRLPQRQASQSRPCFRPKLPEPPSRPPLMSCRRDTS